MDPLGIRNNNPGNLRPDPRPSAEPWQGQAGVDPRGYLIFDTPGHGLRALAKTLLAYYDRHGLLTIVGIISRWAPGNENDTAAYIRYVCDKTGFGRDDWLHLHEPTVLAALVEAIVGEENGQQPYTDAQIQGAVAEALT